MEEAECGGLGFLEDVAGNGFVVGAGPLRRSHKDNWRIVVCGSEHLVDVFEECEECVHVDDSAS